MARTYNDRMIMHVHDVLVALEDECDRVYERLVDNVELEPDSFDASFKCHFRTAEQCPENHLYRLPVFSFTCVRSSIFYSAARLSEIVYRVDVREHSSTRNGVES